MISGGQTTAVIDLSPVEPARLSLRHPLGVTLDLKLTIRDYLGAAVDPATILPQFCLFPRSKGGIYAYDMEAHDATNGIVKVEINGTAFTDSAGYGIEIYSRMVNPSNVPDDPRVPVALIATGVMAMRGLAHQSMGPLGMISVPVTVGPAGPVGATGATGATGPTGQRGSVWSTGSGAPGFIPGQLIGDMYLDEATGNVFRFNGDIWLRGSF
jgi:hypothetical protein